MRKFGWRELFAFGVLFFSLPGTAQQGKGNGSLIRWDSNSVSNGFHDPNFTPEMGNPTRPRESGSNSTSHLDSDLRIYTEGLNELSVSTFTPFKVNVSAKYIQVVGSIDLQTRNMVQTDFEFQAEKLDDDVNIWDDHGRAVLVPGNLICRVTYRSTLTEYKQAGLTLGLAAGEKVNTSPDVTAVAGAGGTYEKLNNEFFESSKRCSVGPIPKLTTYKQIASLCRPCHNRVLPTLKEDVESRMKALTYLVNTPICVSDSECEQENGAWTHGRCTLVKDRNGSMFSECHAKSTIGGSCPGKNSAGMFEYRCDTGLKCTKIHEGEGFTFWKGYDHSKYECRDPKHKEWKSDRDKERALRRASKN